MMQIDYRIKFFGLKVYRNIVERTVGCPEFIHQRMIFQHDFIIFLRQKMNFSSGDLLFQTAYYRRGEHYITNGTEADKEEFGHGRRI